MRAGQPVPHGILQMVMKVIKRILAVLGVVLALFLVGYLLYTGGQLYA